VGDELHPELGRLVDDLELQLVVTSELPLGLLECEQLVGADVLVVVGHVFGIFNQLKLLVLQALF
jgi:hypothetical protein